jgi:septal ring factor EnvC (AmiA/AmiB activator)
MDYVVNKSQFQLHTLLTEQRHPKTWSLSDKIQKDTEAGLRQLFSVDEDIAAKLDELAAQPQAIDQLVAEIESALASERKFISTAAAPRDAWPSRWKAPSGAPSGAGSRPTPRWEPSSRAVSTPRSKTRSSAR